MEGSNQNDIPSTAAAAQIDPRQRRAIAIQRLYRVHRDIITIGGFVPSSTEIRNLLDSFQTDLGGVGAPALPIEVQQQRADLLLRAAELEHEEDANTRDESLAAGALVSDFSNATPIQIEDEVDRRLRKVRPWIPGQQLDLTRVQPKAIHRFISAIQSRYHPNKWPLDKMSREAQEYYLTLWRADKHNGFGLDPRQSPFANIFYHGRSIIRDSDPPPLWKKKARLGEGSFGKVDLWEMTRQNGEPLKIVVKDTQENQFFMDYCNEGNLTLRLNAVGCNNAIKVLDWFYSRSERKYQICYEYAEYRDLADMTEWYNGRSLIYPEAFIWHVFHSLANALVYCHHGNTSGSPIDGWEEIVCSDLKQENILVSEPDVVEHKLYPCVKLADFGHAYTIPSKAVRDFKNPVPWGTQGYRAPEIVQAIDRNNEGRPPARTPEKKEDPGSHSDVWSLGVVISRLMSLVNKYITMENFRKLLHRRLRRGFYSRVLSGLVERCLEPDYERRVTPYELYRITKHYAAEHRREAYQAAEDAAHSNRPFYPQKVLFAKADKDLYTNDLDFRQECIKSNFEDLNEWMGFLEQHSPRDNGIYPNESVAPPENIDIDDIVRAGQLSDRPSASLLEQPFQLMGLKRYWTNDHPFNSDQNNQANNNNGDGNPPAGHGHPNDDAPTNIQPPLPAPGNGQIQRPQGPAFQPRQSHRLSTSSSSSQTFTDASTGPIERLGSDNAPINIQPQQLAPLGVNGPPRHYGPAGSSTSSPLSDVPPGPIVRPFPTHETPTSDASQSQATITNPSTDTSLSSGPSQPDDDDDDPDFDPDVPYGGRVRGDGGMSRREWDAFSAAPRTYVVRGQSFLRPDERRGREVTLQNLRNMRQRRGQREARRPQRRRQREETEEEETEEEEESKEKKQARERDERAQKRQKLKDEKEESEKRRRQQEEAQQAAQADASAGVTQENAASNQDGRTPEERPARSVSLLGYTDPEDSSPPQSDTSLTLSQRERNNALRDALDAL